MGILSDTIDRVPSGWDRSPLQRIAAIAAAGGEPSQRRAWRLWLEAQWAYNAGAIQLARIALDTAERMMAESASAPIWVTECNGLRAKLHQEDGEPARAWTLMIPATNRWLELGRIFARPTAEAGALIQAVMAGVHAMVTAVLDQGTPQELVGVDETTRLKAVVGLWMADRLPSEATETTARAVGLTAKVHGYVDARKVVNDALAATRQWQVPWWQQAPFEIKLRLALSVAAEDERRYASALGQLDDALILAGQLPEERQRTRLTAEIRANRATDLWLLGRPAEAAAEFDRLSVDFRAQGAFVDAQRMDTNALRARHQAGEPVSTEAAAERVFAMEAAAAVLPGHHDGLMIDLEDARRWQLSMLAEEHTTDIDGVIRLLEALRDDQPHLRGGFHADRAVTHVSRPFTVLAARLRMLPDTTLVVVEPGQSGVREPAPVFLVVSSRGPGEALRWELASSAAAGIALNDLGRCASVERDALLSGEISVRAAPSQTLTSVAAAAWTALPDEVRDAIRSGRTVIFMPSAAGPTDAFPFELLRHENGWLGTTHIVARCPSFQVLETMLAPNSRRPADDASALVVTASPSPTSGALADAESEVAIALHAATLLGLESERRILNDRPTLLDAFTGRAVVHYIGHGFASPIGEFLPLPDDGVVSASEVPNSAGGRTPFTFFNACLLGRVRHIPGGRQRGWALRLLERGAPAVVGALEAVPDSICAQVAEAFYAAVWKAPLGEAMRLARARLHKDGMHPLLWAAYALHGDPNAGISTRITSSTADQTRRWPALLTRLLATDMPAYRAELLDALESTPDIPKVVTAWAAGAGVVNDDLAAAVDQMLDRDPEGAAACRILLALARLDRDPNNGDELDIAYDCADALQDGYGILHVLGIHIEAWKRRYPDRHDAIRGVARRWLTALAGDRTALADLEARVANS
jgi:hypothetical protein